MKFNWGWGIALLFSGFVIFMTSLVYQTFQQNCDLVVEDYYSEELKYQELIDKKIKSEQLKEPIRFTIQHGELIIKFPEQFDKNNTSGEVLFFRPSDKRKDIKAALNLNHGEQHFPLSLFSRGLYKIKIDWASSGTKFYNEESIII